MCAQLIADTQRGWAWTRALLGVAAREVHVCGDPSCVALLQKICDVTGMRLDVRHYERLTSLAIDKQGLERGDYKNVQPGDCVIAFSRRDLYAIKAEIEKRSPFRVAMVYGDLPPHTRRAQAQLFNDPDSDYKVPCHSSTIEACSTFM